MIYKSELFKKSKLGTEIFFCSVVLQTFTFKTYDAFILGNLEEVLDPKLTLNDYQITEIYVVSKRLSNLNQAFSPADIMVLRREEERKQMHNKSGGGVLNLIFKKVKPVRSFVRGLSGIITFFVTEYGIGISVEQRQQITFSNSQ